MDEIQVEIFITSTHKPSDPSLRNLGIAFFSLLTGPKREKKGFGIWLVCICACACARMNTCVLTQVSYLTSVSLDFSLHKAQVISIIYLT
jgi:hypothetical protein